MRGGGSRAPQPVTKIVLEIPHLCDGVQGGPPTSGWVYHGTQQAKWRGMQPKFCQGLPPIFYSVHYSTTADKDEDKYAEKYVDENKDLMKDNSV